MNTRSVSPQRGEIWLVDFNPTVGSEIQKILPAVVLSSDGLGKLPLRLVAPMTTWKDAFADNLWHVRVEPDSNNGLTKISAVDALQVRGADVKRFIERKGRMSASHVEEVVAALAAITEFS